MSTMAVSMNPLVLLLLLLLLVQLHPTVETRRMWKSTKVQMFGIFSIMG
jgi:hypothetical protein